MSQPAIAAPSPPFLRAFDWWLGQVKHMVPPTLVVSMIVPIPYLRWIKPRMEISSEPALR